MPSIKTAVEHAIFPTCCAQGDLADEAVSHGRGLRGDKAGIRIPEFLTKMDDITHGHRAGTTKSGVLGTIPPWLL